MGKKETIKISQPLYKQLTEKAKKNNFKSIDEYVEHVLSQLLGTDEDILDMTEEEEEEVKARLKSLGYL